MKTVHFFSLLLCLTFFGCTKSNDTSSPLFIDNTASVADYSTALVGKWQLSEIENERSYVNADGNIYKETRWNKAAANEILRFDCMGAFTKDLKGDEPCKGDFQVTDGILTLKSNCGTESNSLEMTRMTLILNNQSQATRYKYTRLE